MRTTITLGSTPADEPCAQVGTYGYELIARAECVRYIALLGSVFGPPPVGSSLLIKSNNHDFGQYVEVGYSFDDEDPDHVRFASALEDHAPLSWKDTERYRWPGGQPPTESWWEPVEFPKWMYGVFRAEACAAEPDSLHVNERDARDAMDRLNALLREDGCYADAFVAKVRTSDWKFWNSLDASPPDEEDA